MCMLCILHPCTSCLEAQTYSPNYRMLFALCFCHIMIDTMTLHEYNVVQR